MYSDRANIIKNIISSVPNVGVVVPFEVYDTISNVLNSLSDENGKIQGWMIHREDCHIDFSDFPLLEKSEFYSITGIGQMSSSGESVFDWQDISDAICSKINCYNWDRNHALKLITPASLEEVSTIQIAKTMFHQAEISLSIAYEESII